MSRDIEDFENNMSDSNRGGGSQSSNRVEPSSSLSNRDSNVDVIPWSEFAVDFHSSTPSLNDVKENA